MIIGLHEPIEGGTEMVRRALIYFETHMDLWSHRGESRNGVRHDDFVVTGGAERSS